MSESVAPDPELAAMAGVADLLNPLSVPAIGRVLAWAHERYLGVSAQQQEQLRLEMERQAARDAVQAAEAEEQRQRRLLQIEAEKKRADEKMARTMRRRATKAAAEMENPDVRKAVEKYYELTAFPFIRRCVGDGSGCGAWSNRFDAHGNCMRHTVQPDVVRKRMEEFELFLLDTNLDPTWRPSQALLLLNWEKRIVPIPDGLVEMVPLNYEPEVAVWSN